LKLHHIIPVLILIISICSCHHEQRKGHHKKHQSKSVSNDTLLITKRSAISVWVDTATLEKRRKQYGDSDFYTVADDDVYYYSLTDSFLKSQHLPVTTVKGYQYLKFVQSDKASTVVNIDTLQQIYTMYFFDPSKAPKGVDVPDIENEYNRFYH
jgi:hypothetical protein